jgi:hypothetical protein
VNLERLKIRDPSSATAIKNYVEGIEIIPLKQEKLLMNKKN